MSLFRSVLESMPSFHRRHARMRGRIAKRIASLLREEGMKQVDLATSAGVTKSFVSRVLRGSTAITTETIAKLEEALGREIIYVWEPGEPEQIRIGGQFSSLRLTSENLRESFPQVSAAPTGGFQLSREFELSVREGQDV